MKSKKKKMHSQKKKKTKKIWNLDVSELNQSQCQTMSVSHNVRI